MNIINLNNQNDVENVTTKVCNFFNIDKPKISSKTTNEAIKELCVMRLCKEIGITGIFNYKSDFFDFFASIMGEAVSEILNLKTCVACDELRFVKYEHINLIDQVKIYLEQETIEEAFLDAFELADKFKYLIPKLKKISL